MTTQAPGSLTLAPVTITGGSNSPWAIPLEHDSLEVGGITYGPANPDGVSGKVTVRRAKRHYKWQKKDPPGSDGYVSTYRGITPKEFDLVFWFWTDKQYLRLAGQIIPLFTIVGTKGKTNPVTIYSPKLADIGISQVTTDNIMAYEPVSEEKPDLYRWVVEVTEYLPPPVINTTSTPSTPLSSSDNWVSANGVGGPPPGKQPNPAVVQLQQSNENLTNQLKGAPSYIFQNGPPFG